MKFNNVEIGTDQEMSEEYRAFMDWKSQCLIWIVRKKIRDGNRKWAYCDYWLSIQNIKRNQELEAELQTDRQAVGMSEALYNTLRLRRERKNECR